jgi:4-amino-4-deoxy-L-arabinose transferase-like glycosyltransferase
MTSPTRTFRNWPWIWLLLAAFLVVLNVVWLQQDNQPFAWDESIHYMGAVGYYKALAGFDAQTFLKVLYLSDFYPPLHELMTGTLFLVTQPSVKIAAFTNVIYLVMILLLFWRLGVRWFGEPAGLLAAFVFSASTAVIIQSKYFMLDIPLAFWVLAGFYCFCASRNFTLRFWSLLYGVVFAAALLNKWSAAFFLAAPPLLTALRAGWKREELRRDSWRNIILAYAVTALLAAPWYSVHFIKLLHSSSGLLYARGVLIGNPPLLSPWSWTYYLFAVVRQMSWPLGLLLLLGAGIALWQRRHLWIWALWVGMPYLILTLIRNKDNRYTIPLLPLIGLMAFSWIDVLSVSARRWVQWLIIIFAVAQIGYAHVGSKAGNLYAVLSKTFFGQPLVDSQTPKSDLWPAARILKNVGDLGPDFTRRPVLRVVPDDSHFNRVTFVVEQSNTASAVYLSGNTNWPTFTDFVITKTGSLGLPFAIEQPRAITQALLAMQSDSGRRFDLVKKYALPDGTEAALFMRRDPADPGPPAKILDELHRDLARLLAQYIREAKKLTVEIIPGTPEQTMQGHFQGIVINVQDGYVGDFQHKPLGLPVKSLQLEISDLVIDLPESRQGRLIPYTVGQLKVHRLELNDQLINAALTKAGGDLKKISTVFGHQRIQTHWQGSPAASLELEFNAIRDPGEPLSDNLQFKLKRLRIFGVWWPIGWLQPFVEDFNPLFKLNGFPGQVVLGTLAVEKGRLFLGSDSEK